MAQMKRHLLTTNREGYVLVTVAILLVVLLLFAALAIDLGVLYGARTAAQKAADAAAMAGALVFVVDPSPATVEIQDRAVATAAQNLILGTPATITDDDVSVDMVNRRVTVDVERTQARGNPVSTYLARVIMDTADIRVQATAEASREATSSDCPKPWMLPSTAFHPPHISPCQACEPNAHEYDAGASFPWPGFDPALGAPPDGPRVLIDRNGNVTPFADWLTQTGAYSPPNAWANEFIVKPQSPHQALVPSNFFPIQVSGSGAALYRADIAGCGGQVKCGDQYTVETGNMVGPTRQGVNDLCALEDRHYELLATKHRYFDPTGLHRAPNPQLAVVPIWNSCNDPFFVYDPSTGQCPAEVVPPGTGTWYTVSAFAQIFIEGMVGQGAQVRLISITQCSGSSGTVNLDETGPLALPVRLVRVPVEE